MNNENDQQTLVEKRFAAHPERFRDSNKKSILQGKVVLGMWPTEAGLAAGNGAYQVKADPSKWGDNSNPMDVMNAQCTAPDNSEIKIRFKNSTQFDGALKSFVVLFERGVAVQIREE